MLPPCSAGCDCSAQPTELLLATKTHITAWFGFSIAATTSFWSLFGSKGPCYLCCPTGYPTGCNPTAGTNDASAQRGAVQNNELRLMPRCSVPDTAPPGCLCSPAAPQVLGKIWAPSPVQSRPCPGVKWSPSSLIGASGIFKSQCIWKAKHRPGKDVIKQTFLSCWNALLKPPPHKSQVDNTLRGTL